MASVTKKLKCGDAPYCDECTTRTSEKDSSGDAPAYLTPNLLGRCDFYKGPNETKSHPAKAY